MAIWVSLLGLVLAALQVGQSALPLPSTDQRFEVFGSYLESLRAQAKIPGLAAAIVGSEGDIVWERAFGLQDVERNITTLTSTPFHVDGLTQIFTATLVLKCVQEGRIELSDRLGEFDPASPDAGLTIEQALSHTTGTPRHLTFAYRPGALTPLGAVIERCEGPLRPHLAQWLRRSGMMDSVPGPDVIRVPQPIDGIDAGSIARYRDVLDRLAVPYAISKSGRPSPSRGAETLTPASGLVTTVRDLASFDKALRTGFIISRETLTAAWMMPSERFGQPLPHGLGWFVQMYAGEKIVWQFGVNDNASSSLVMTVPGRGFSVVLLANSDGLVNPYALANGDLSASPFGRLILGTFFR